MDQFEETSDEKIEAGDQPSEATQWAAEADDEELDLDDIEEIDSDDDADDEELEEVGGAAEEF